MLSSGEIDLLEELFSFKEIKEAIWMSDSEKILGPDGFNMRFFKVCWNSIKEDLLCFINGLYSKTKLPKASLPC